MTKILAFIDHYDSFSFNVIDWLGQGGINVRYVAFDDPKAMQVAEASGMPLVISPGPKHPRDARPTLELLQRSIGNVPILGICLGHQLLALASGGTIGPCAAPFHGRTRDIEVLDSKGMFAGFSQKFKAASYNSLTVMPSLDRYEVLARCDQGEVQALSIKPIAGKSNVAWGVQFHPESFMSEQAHLLRANWLRAAFKK